MSIEGSVEVEASCEFSACGGDLANTSWQYTSVCVEESSILGPLQEVCADIELLDAGGQISGTLDFSDAGYQQNLTLEVDGQVRIPASCQAAAYCPLVPAALVAAGIPSASCQMSGSDCLCDVPIDLSDDSAGDFSASGNQLTLDQQTGEYCGSGGFLSGSGQVQDVEFIYEMVAD